MTNSSDLGPLILAGSGEYTPTMEVVDRYLLAACDGRPVLLIATACAQEGDERMTWWEELGVAHFRRLGVEALPLRIRDRSEADRPEHAERIAAAGGGRGREAARGRGAGVAGAGGGRGVLNAAAPSPWPDAPPGPTALGLAAPVRAMAHFNRMEARRPEVLERIVSSRQAGPAIGRAHV